MEASASRAAARRRIQNLGCIEFFPLVQSGGGHNRPAARGTSRSGDLIMACEKIVRAGVSASPTLGHVELPRDALRSRDKLHVAW